MPSNSVSTSAPIQRPAHYGRTGAALLFTAVFGAFIWKPLLLLSLALLIATFTLAIVSMVRGRVITGVALIVGCVVATLLTFTSALGGGDVIDEMRKQRDKVGATTSQAGIEALIAAHEVKVGMTEAQCLEAWGPPDKQNDEQWVYWKKTASGQRASFGGKRYLYFGNGRLVSFDDGNG